jgi:hypothetical protein
MQLQLTCLLIDRVLINAPFMGLGAKFTVYFLFLKSGLVNKVSFLILVQICQSLRLVTEFSFLCWVVGQVGRGVDGW